MDFIKCNEIPKGLFGKRKYKKLLLKMLAVGIKPLHEFNVFIHEEHGAYMGDIYLKTTGTFPERFRDYITTKEECTSLAAKGYQFVEGPPVNKKTPDSEYKVTGIYCSNWREIKEAQKGLNNFNNI